jgi:hypothetical protein
VGWLVVNAYRAASERLVHGIVLSASGGRVVLSLSISSIVEREAGE